MTPEMETLYLMRKSLEREREREKGEERENARF